MPSPSGRLLGITLALSFMVGGSSSVQAGLPKVPEGFRVRSVANVPAVVYPCQVATAPDGSVFIAEDPMDQLGPYESSHGKILRIKDGGEPTVFAEGFRAIFGMAWRDGALYVSHMPFLTVLRDADGDGKAEGRTELFRDLGITDNKGLNDHIVSGLQFGIDGFLYIATGDKGIYRATGPDGRTAQVVGGGIVRCRPDGTGIEVFSTGTRNHLEPNLDARDNLFTYDNTDDGDGWWTRVTHHIDGGYYGYPYDYHDHPDRFLNRMAEYASGSPCGGLVYKEDAWPDAYRGRALWAEWGKRAVRAFQFEPQGASFRVADVTELAEPDGSSDFRPIDLALSYDGKTLYVADWGMGGWGNKAEKVGRVYAIDYVGPPIATRPRLDDSAPIAAQIEQLAHPSFNERMRAQLALIKVGESALMPVARTLADTSFDPVARRHMVWILDGLAGGTPKAYLPLNGLLADPTPDIRAQAARALGERAQKEAVPALLNRVTDPDPTVRLQVITALGRIGDPKAVAALVPLLVDPDRTLAFATRQALRRIGDWPATAKVLEHNGSPALRLALIHALETVESPEAVRLLARLATDVKTGSPDRILAIEAVSVVHHLAPPWDGKWWGTRPTKGQPPARTITWEGTPLVLDVVRTLRDDPDASIRVAAIHAARVVDDRESLPALRARFQTDPDPMVRREVAVTLGAMRDADAVDPLLMTIRDEATAAVIRDAALVAIESIHSPRSSSGLTEVLEAIPLATRPRDQVGVIAALGRLKVRGAVAALVGRLVAPEPSVREAALRSLRVVGVGAGVEDRIRPLLSDPDLAVRKAAIDASAGLEDRGAVPALIAAAGIEETSHEAATALAALPDPRALAVYLRNLSAKNPELRVASAEALTEIRDQAAPILGQLADRRELPASSLPELRRIFTPLDPLKDWHLVGPFEAGARPPVPLGPAVDFAARLAGDNGSELTWQAATSDPASGSVNVQDHYPGPQVGSVFAAATVPSAKARPARLQVSTEGGLTLWLNGKETIKADGPRGRARAEKPVDIDLREGENRILVRLTRRPGTWTFAVRVTGTEVPSFLVGPASGGFDPQAYRDQARAGRGASDHGKALFFDLKGMACSKCHAVGGQGGTVGPDLSGVGAKYPREELMTSILEPSARISSGYEPVVVATTDGRVLTGLVKLDTPETLEIEDSEARRVRIPREDVEDRRPSDLSLMPGGLVEGISRNDFADLIAYLETLRDQAPAAATPPKPTAQP